MEIEIDKFYEERRHEREVSSPLNLRTILMAFGLHVAAFVFFWIAAQIIYRTPDVIIRPQPAAKRAAETRTAQAAAEAGGAAESR